jgi:hypothetical protein
MENKIGDNSNVQPINPVPFRLYPTQNIWTFIKLDTRNGKMWQVQFSMKTEGRFETYLNLEPIVSKENEVNDRFTLYPTQNMASTVVFRTRESWTYSNKLKGCICNILLMIFVYLLFAENHIK